MNAAQLNFHRFVRPAVALSCCAIGIGLTAQNVTTFQVTTGGQTTSLAVNHQAPAPAGDTDRNGLPDAWELQYFGHIGVDPGVDADGDGLTNAQEYAAGTDPNDPTAGDLVITPILADGNRLFADNTMRVRVTNRAGRPVANVLVRLHSLNDNQLETSAGTGDQVEARTDANGLVRIKIVPADGGGPVGS